MKHLLLTTIAAVVMVGCGESQQSAPTPEAKPVEPVAEASQPDPPTVEAPDISISEAAWDGNIEAVKQHLAAGTDVNAKNKNGWTPLHAAAFEDHKEIAELLIAKGADVNAKNRDDWTPLHFAALEDHKEITELLIAKGADVNAKDVSGETPLDVATHPDNSNASAETADLLRKHGGKSGAADSIHVAAAVVNIEAVKQHLAAGADVNAKNKVGQTPLHLAVANDHKEIIELLIAKDADLNAKDVWEGTPLYEAASKAHKEIAELLIANGADVNANIYGWTPLHSAARDGHKEIAELFITEGADVNAKDQDANTPLDRAKFFPNRKSMKRHSETANLLRKHGGKTSEELKAEGK